MTQPTLQVAGIQQDSIVDGPGLRFVLFLQGCELHCPDCQNPQTHDRNGGETYTVAQVWATLKANPLTQGLTISGGEPFLQAAAAATLATCAKEDGLSVWCFTGMTWENLCRDNAPPAWSLLLSQLDVLVDGPFISKQRTLTHRWRGSTNQRVIDVPASLAQGHVVLHCE